jgi:hypothetical protein
VDFFLTLQNVGIRLSLATLFRLVCRLLAIELWLCVAQLRYIVVGLNQKRILLDFRHSKFVVLIQRNAHNFEVFLLVPVFEFEILLLVVSLPDPSLHGLGLLSRLFIGSTLRTQI